MCSDYVPVSKRGNPEAAATFTALQPGVPPWLVNPLEAWVWSHISYARDVSRIGRRVRERVPRISILRELSMRVRVALPEEGTTVRQRLRVDGELLLDVAEALLADAATDDKNELAELLDESGSLYRVEDNLLVERVSPGAEELAKAVTTREDAAAALMMAAWNAAFGREPNLERAMDRANKAIEAAYAPIVIPASPRPSTGTVITAIRDKPEKFSARLAPDGTDSVDAICSWLEVFWKAQSRHVGHHDLEADEVRDAVVIATTLVDLAQRGGFRLAT